MNQKPIYGGLTLSQAIELKKLSAHIFGNDKFKVLTEEEENSEECKRYFVLVNIRMGYLRSLHCPQAVTFLPQPTNLVQC